MAGATAEATAEGMVATLEVTAAHMEDTPGEAMVTAKGRLSQDTAPMDLMVVAMGATPLDMDLTEVAMGAIALDMEVDMVATPEAADHMAAVTATGVNYLALDTKKTIQLF